MKFPFLLQVEQPFSVMASSVYIINPAQFDVKNIVFASPKEQKKDKFTVVNISVFYRYPDGTIAPLRLQTPRARLPFGLSAYQSEEKPNEVPSYSISYSLDGYEDVDSKMQEFYSILRKTDQHCLEMIKNKRTEIWEDGDELRDTTIEDRFNSSIRKPKKGTDYAPTFRTRVLCSQKDGKIFTAFFDQHRQAISPSECIPGTQGVGLIECSKLWFLKECGSVWITRQVKCYPSNSINDQCHVFEEHEEEEEEEGEGEKWRNCTL